MFGFVCPSFWNTQEHISWQQDRRTQSQWKELKTFNFITILEYKLAGHNRKYSLYMKRLIPNSCVEHVSCTLGWRRRMRAVHFEWEVNGQSTALTWQPEPNQREIFHKKNYWSTGPVITRLTINPLINDNPKQTKMCFSAPQYLIVKLNTQNC